MVAAIGITFINAVFPFGRFAVAFKLFMPARLLAQPKWDRFVAPIRSTTTVTMPSEAPLPEDAVIDQIGRA